MTDPAPLRLELLVGRVLHWGAVTSTVLLAVGLLLQLAGVQPALSSQFTRAGLIVLMATPVARVIVSVINYAAQRDWTFLALTAAVLAILIGSLLV